MSRCKLKYLFCVQILFGLVNAGVILQNATDQMPVAEEYTRTIIEITYPPFDALKQSDRTKLKIFYGYENKHLYSELYLVEDRDLMDRNSTGIYFAEPDPNAHQGVKYTPRPDFFDKIGEFEFFQSHDDLSAITRFTNSSSGEVTYSGMLMQKYVLKDVPESFRQRMGAITLSGLIAYMKKTTDDPVPTDNVTETESQGGQNPPKVVYPKLLLSPSFALTQREKGPEDFIKELIALMNCADMSYRTLSEPKIRLHISGIIIPLNESAHPYIVPIQEKGFLVSPITTPPTFGPISGYNYTGFDTLYETMEFFDKESQRFPTDKHNMVVVVTERYMGNRGLFGGLSTAAGIALPRTLCERLTNSGGAISVTYQMEHMGVISMIHELGHAFGAYHEGEDKAKDCKGGKFTMAQGYFGTLRWSPCNQRVLKEYFTSSLATCSRNRPVAIPESKINLPESWMPIAGHCLNVLRGSAPGHCVSGEAYGCVNNATCVSSPKRIP